MENLHRAAETGKENKPIGFVGLGTMGKPMAVRLATAGYALLVHDLDRGHADPVLAAGGQWTDSLDHLAEHCSTVLLSLPGPPQVRAVTEQLLRGLKPGSTLVDLSTNSVKTVRTLAAQCQEQSVSFLDCPVSGGYRGCEEGTLVIMAGGNKEALHQVEPALEPLSRRIIYLGDSGAGTIAKLVNNQLYLCGEVIFYEGLVLAAKAGLDIHSLLDILNMTGAGGIHSKVADRVISRKFDDQTFALALAEKDVALALDAGKTLDVPMPATASAHELYAAGIKAGLGMKNFWSVFELIESQAGTRVSE